MEKACDQDLTHSLDTLKSLSLKIVPQIVIRDTCGTWQGTCRVTSIHSIQESIRNSEKLGNKLAVSQTIYSVNDRRFNGQKRKKSSW